MSDTEKQPTPKLSRTRQQVLKTQARLEQQREKQLQREEEKKQKLAEKKRKPTGRPRNKNFLTWEEAKEFMRDEMIPSQAKFMEWWEKNKPKVIPKYPYRVYKEWTTWNDFLGTDNEWGKKKSWREFDQAVLWAQSLKLQTQAEWTEYAKTATDFPEDIPKRPDLTYKLWRTWSHWLGNKPAAIVEAKREAEKHKVYYMIHERDVPGNVITFGIVDHINELKERWNVEHFDIVKLFWYDPEQSNMVDSIVHYCSSSYMGDERQRVAPNVYDIIWRLQSILDIIKL